MPAPQPQPSTPRCTATTRSGDPCPNPPMLSASEASPDTPDPGRSHLCHIHAGHTIPHEDDPRRCTVRLSNGRRCRNWGHSQSKKTHGRVLCYTHSPNTIPNHDDPRRCTARTKSGAPCRAWATTASRRDGRSLCVHHHPDHHYPLPDDDADAAGMRCTATTAGGERCPQWAAGDSQERWGRPLCGVHGNQVTWRLPGPGDNRCTATTAAGKQCAHWALRDSEPPLCWLHANAHQHPKLRHGFYRRRAHLHQRQKALLNAIEAQHGPVAASLALLRLKLGELLAYTATNDLTPHQWKAATRIVHRALRTIARLQRQLPHPGAEPATRDQPPHAR